MSFECGGALIGTTVAWRVCSSPVTVRDIREGLWLFEVRAVDAWGNRSDPPAQVLVNVDRSPPVIRFRRTPLPRDRARTSSFDFFPNEEVAGPITCRLDDVPAQDCSTGSFAVEGLPEGTHTLQVTATDTLGYQGTTWFRWTVDRTPPLITISGIPSVTGSTSVTVSVSVSESLSTIGGGPRFDCVVDGAPIYFHDCHALLDGPVTASGFADGPHTLTVRGVDAAMNVSDPVTVSWIVDTDG